MTAKEGFDTISQKVKALLSPLETYSLVGTKAEGYEADLYLIDETIDKELIYLRSQLETCYSGKEDAKTFAFNKIIKHLNPARPVSKFGVYAQRKWEQVSDPERVLKRLDGRFAVYVNVERKRLKQKIDAGNYSEEEARKMRQELEEEIAMASQRLEETRANFDTLDVRISAKGDMYGTISFRTSDQRQYSRHLSKTVPNALFYRRAEIRPDDELSRYMMDAKKVFGDVYAATLTPERIERRHKAAEKERAKKRGKRS